MLCDEEGCMALYRRRDENPDSEVVCGGVGGGPVVVMVGTVAEVGVEYVRGREKRAAAGEELRPFAPPVFPFEPFGRNPDAGAEATSPFSARSISSRHTATLRCA